MTISCVVKSLNLLCFFISLFVMHLLLALLVSRYLSSAVIVMSMTYFSVECNLLFTRSSLSSFYLILSYLTSFVSDFSLTYFSVAYCLLSLILCFLPHLLLPHFTCDPVLDGISGKTLVLLWGADTQ